MKNTVTTTTEVLLNPMKNGVVSVEFIKRGRDMDLHGDMLSACAACEHFSRGSYRVGGAPFTLDSWPTGKYPVLLCCPIKVRITEVFGNNDERDPFVLNGAMVSQVFEAI